MHRPHHVVVACVVVIALSTLHAGSQEPAEVAPALIRTCCDDAGKHLLDWNRRAAKSAYLRAAWIAQEHFPDHAMAGRAYLGLAEVTLARREMWASRYFSAAHHQGALQQPRSAAVADGLALLLFTPAQSDGLDPLTRLGGTLFTQMSPDLRKTLARFGPGRSPGAADAAQLEALGMRTAERIATQKLSPAFALAALDRAYELLARRLGSSLDPSVRNTAARLAERVSAAAVAEAERLRAEAKRLKMRNNTAGAPDHPALAFSLGETHRIRWRCDHKSAKHGEAAEACYRVTLAAEPDHAGAARGLAAILIGTGRREEAARAMKSLVENLLLPARAWGDAPVIPAAPRYIVATDALKLLLDDVAEGDSRGLVLDLVAWTDDAQIEPYLELGPAFHPEDAIASSNDLRIQLENNTGFGLMARWDLTRAEQHLLRCVIPNWPDPKRYLGLMPAAYQNLGHLYMLRAELDRAVENYRNAAHLDPKNPVAANNLGAILGMLGAITGEDDLIREGVTCYEKAVELAPAFVFAKSSRGFMSRVLACRQRFAAGDRTPPVVWSYANSFLFAARSLAEGENPRYLQAMRILDAGFQSLPSETEMLEVFGPTGAPPPMPGETVSGTLHERIAAVLDHCVLRAIRKYEALQKKHGADNPHLNFLLGEAHRLAWRRADYKHRDPAIACYEKTLAAAPDHVSAVLGLVELLRSLGEQERAIKRLDAVVAELLKPWRPWPGEPETFARPRIKAVVRLVGKVGKGADRKGLIGKFMVRALDAATAAQRAHAGERLDGKDPEAWNNLGYLEIMAAKQLEDDDRLLRALEALDKARAFGPDRAGPALNRMHVLQLLGRDDEAEAIRDAMQRRFPEDARFRPQPPKKSGGK